VNTKYAGAAAATAMPPETPEIDGVFVSMPVMVLVAAAKRVLWKDPAPAERALSPGSNACASVLVK